MGNNSSDLEAVRRFNDACERNEPDQLFKAMRNLKNALDKPNNKHTVSYFLSG